ncbi:hypothetical protein DQ04_12851000, partial [Trypanosoma grayi]|uniref:hypothetical protein n=1 Tax=Trypanosoma grayi TaxID=71804 RepID=UPI0004F49AFB
MSASNKREDGAGRAPACAAFACCVCRRIVTLDGRGVACGAGLPLALPSSMCTAPSVVAAAAAAASPLRPPSGVFLKTSRVLHVEDTVAERRRRRDQRASLLKARDEAWRDQQRQHQENVKGSGGGDAEAALDEWEEQETAHRQLLHPAIRGSLLSAAGKYTPLAPSPLTPWLNTRYARLKNGLYNTSGTAPATVDARRTMTAEARIVARLSPSFSYQYAWLSAAEAETYIGELWRMLHDAPVPPPGSSTPLTVQCDEFRRGEEQKLQQAEQQQTAGMTTEVTTTPLGSPQLLPSSRRVSQLSFASANNIPSLEGSPTMNLCAPSLVPGRTAPSPLFAVTAITSGCSPRALPTLHMRKIEAMRLHAVDSDSTRRGRTSLTSRIPPKATIPLPQLLSSSAAAAVTAALPSREVYISTFARHLMRRVVHNAGTDLPLCPRCCKEALEMQQKSVGQVVEDVVGLAAAYANPDAVSFVLCYRAGCAREETTRPGLCDASAINTREAPLASSNNDNSNKNSPTSEGQNHHQQWQQDREDGLVGVQNILVNSDVSVSCVVQQEALQRLKLELLEAEAQSRLLSAFLQAFRHEADVLAAQRRVEASALCAKMAAARNAQQVRAFFDVEDAASGVALRMQNAMRSCAFVAKTSAVLLAFPVRTSGVVATIAGLRLGQHPANSAAW